MRGTNVCRTHGGSAPQVRRAAALRLTALVEPAIATLAREMVKAEKSADKQRAANSILDRAGILRGPGAEVEAAREILLQQLIGVRKAILTGSPAPAPDSEILDAVVVPD